MIQYLRIENINLVNFFVTEYVKLFMAMFNHPNHDYLHLICIKVKIIFRTRQT